MRNKLNFYSVRSAKTTSDRLVRPAFARDPNTTFNTGLNSRLFGGRVALHASPLTAVLNHVLNPVLRRTQRQSRSHIHTVLLTGMLGFALLLAGCGGGGGGGGNGVDDRAVSNVQTIVTGNNITVRWTNPEQENITGFTINWVNVGDDANASDSGERALNASLANVAAGASDNTYQITNLDYAATYRITVTVLYADQDPAASAPTSVHQAMTGMDPDNPVVPLDPAAVSNVQATVTGNTITVSWTNPNREGITGFNITWINVGDDADPTDRRDIVLTDPPANVAAGADNTDTITDLTYAATYRITVTVLYAGQDPAASGPVQRSVTIDQDLTDTDDDGVVDADDNCQSVANPDQLNSDTDALGDACDDDDDEDGTPDTTDVDDNDNGLIEIRYLDDLARLRVDLNGDGTAERSVTGITAVGSVGCPANGGCIGYELTRSLNFSDTASYNASSVNVGVWTERSGSGWNPIGFCSSDTDCTAYTGMFDGQDWTLADLFIDADTTVNGVGLFAAFNGTLQNLHLRNADVRGGDSDLGTLVGNGRRGRYENLSVTGGSVMSAGADRVGGLIGDGEESDIRYVSVSGITVSGQIRVGGLIGNGQSVNISYAGVSGVDVTGTQSNVGGLVGDGDNSNIRYAHVSDGDVSGQTNVGGLIGNGQSVNISYAGVSGVDVTGTGNNVGGLVGIGNSAEIRYAYVFGGSVEGERNVGGLVGDGPLAVIDYSYTASGEVSALAMVSPNVGGLLGAGSPRRVTASYWDRNTTEQSASSGSDGRRGEGKTTAELQNPITFSGSIYADWGNFWCDPDTGAESVADTRPAGFESVWDLGANNQYPVLNCLPVSAEQQQEQQQ